MNQNKHKYYNVLSPMYLHEKNVSKCTTNGISDHKLALHTSEEPFSKCLVHLGESVQLKNQYFSKTLT